MKIRNCYQGEIERGKGGFEEEGALERERKREGGMGFYGCRRYFLKDFPAIFSFILGGGGYCTRNCGWLRGSTADLQACKNVASSFERKRGVLYS